MGQSPESVSAYGICYLRKGVEDVVFLNLMFPGERIAQVHVSWLDPHKERKLVVVGSNKMLVFDDMEINEKVKIYDKGAEIKETASFIESISVRHGDITIPLVPSTEPLLQEMKHFIECVKDAKRPLSGVDEGLEVVRILEAGDKSLKSSGIVVPID